VRAVCLRARHALASSVHVAIAETHARRLPWRAARGWRRRRARRPPAGAGSRARVPLPPPPRAAAPPPASARSCAAAPCPRAGTRRARAAAAGAARRAKWSQPPQRAAGRSAPARVLDPRLQGQATHCTASMAAVQIVAGLRSRAPRACALLHALLAFLVGSVRPCRSGPIRGTPQMRILLLTKRSTRPCTCASA